MYMYMYKLRFHHMYLKARMAIFMYMYAQSTRCGQERRIILFKKLQCFAPTSRWRWRPPIPLPLPFYQRSVRHQATHAVYPVKREH